MSDNEPTFAQRLTGRARRTAPTVIPEEVRVRLDRQHSRIAAVERDLARIGPQVAALEHRIEELRQRLDTPDLGADAGERAEARSLVEEIRREHEQIRARISAAARYEERLRQVEERVAGLEGGPTG